MSLRLLFLWLLAVVLGCEPPPAEVQVEAEEDGLRIESSVPLHTVDLRHKGESILTHRLPAPLQTLHLPLDWQPGSTIRVRCLTGEGWVVRRLDLPEEPPLLRVRVEAPVGQGQNIVTDGDTIAFPLVEGAEAVVAIEIRAREDASVEIQMGEMNEQVQLMAGQKHLVLPTISAPLDVQITTDDHQQSFSLVPDPVSHEALEEDLSLVSTSFPAERTGEPDQARPAGRVTLPALWWQALTRQTRLGFRPQDLEVPWAWQALTLENHSDRDLNIAIQARVLNAEGEPDPAFRPRVRQGSDGTGSVNALLRIPAGSQATAALPLFVDQELLEHPSQVDQPRSMSLSLTPIGSSEPILETEIPLSVSRGSTVASLGLVGVILTTLLGLVTLVLGVPRWIRDARTSDLVTIAMFGTLSFVVGAASQLLGMGVSALMGPFAVLLTALVDGALRVTLLATLITLRPQVGTASLATLVGWLLQGLVFGDFSPTGMAFLLSRLVILEGCLWLVGLTRSGSWRDQSRLHRWLRLAMGMGMASMISQAIGLVLQVVLFRLFLADWYVMLILALPGLLYPMLAAALAVPFAESLREVED